MESDGDSSTSTCTSTTSSLFSEETHSDFSEQTHPDAEIRNFMRFSQKILKENSDYGKLVYNLLQEMEFYKEKAKALEDLVDELTEDKSVEDLESVKREAYEFVEVNGVPLKFRVDTGATVNTIFIEDYDKRMGTLHPLSETLEGIGGQVRIVGEIKDALLTNITGKKARGDIQVLANDGNVDTRDFTILGMQACLMLDIMDYNKWGIRRKRKNCPETKKKGRKKKTKSFRKWLKNLFCCC